MYRLMVLLNTLLSLLAVSGLIMVSLDQRLVQQNMVSLVERIKLVDEQAAYVHSETHLLLHLQGLTVVNHERENDQVFLNLEPSFPGDDGSGASGPRRVPEGLDDLRAALRPR